MYFLLNFVAIKIAPKMFYIQWYFKVFILHLREILQLVLWEYFKLENELTDL